MAEVHVDSAADQKRERREDLIVMVGLMVCTGILAYLLWPKADVAADGWSEWSDWAGGAGAPEEGGGVLVSSALYGVVGVIGLVGIARIVERGPRRMLASFASLFGSKEAGAVEQETEEEDKGEDEGKGERGGDITKNKPPNPGSWKKSPGGGWTGGPQKPLSDMEKKMKKKKKEFEDGLALKESFKARLVETKQAYTTLHEKIELLRESGKIGEQEPFYLTLKDRCFDFQSCALFIFYYLKFVSRAVEPNGELYKDLINLQKEWAKIHHKFQANSLTDDYLDKALKFSDLDKHLTEEGTS